jgi:hypothetical protein
MPSIMPSINPSWQPGDLSASLPPRYLAGLAPVPEIEGALIEADRRHHMADHEASFRRLPFLACGRSLTASLTSTKAFKVGILKLILMIGHPTERPYPPDGWNRPCLCSGVVRKRCACQRIYDHIEYPLLALIAGSGPIS